MTIKQVLDIFADEDDLVVVSLDYSGRRSIRTREYSDCPLQVATGSACGYEDAARRAGLTSEDIAAIKFWSDNGKWRMY